MASVSHGPQPTSSTCTDRSSRIVFDDRERLGDWALAARIPGTESWGEWYQAIGHEIDGELAAVVVYNYFTGFNIAMHVAAIPGTRWATSEYLRAVFGYPFGQLKVNRVTGYVARKEKALFKFYLALGFKREGIMRKALKDDDLITLGMTKRECKWV